jgi:hypothetical protein
MFLPIACQFPCIERAGCTKPSAIPGGFCVSAYAARVYKLDIANCDIKKLAETVQLHDDQIKVITRVLQQMIEKPASPKKRIGFHTNDAS